MHRHFEVRILGCFLGFGSGLSSLQLFFGRCWLRRSTSGCPGVKRQHCPRILWPSDWSGQDTGSLESIVLPCCFALARSLRNLAKCIVFRKNREDEAEDTEGPHPSLHRWSGLRRPAQGHLTLMMKGGPLGHSALSAGQSCVRQIVLGGLELRDSRTPLRDATLLWRA